MKGDFGLTALALVLVLGVALAGMYDFGLQITGFATGPGWAEMTIQTCLSEDNVQKANFQANCDGTYPAACGVAGDLLSCNDSLSETHGADGSCPNCYAGLQITLYNSSVTDCSNITSVFLCYEWWGETGLAPTDCNIAVDNQNGTSFTNATTVCPGTTADPGVTCTNVTGLKSWTCSNFFGASGNRSMIQSELKRSSGGSKLIYWDVLFFNVTYTFADTTAPQWSNNKTFPTSPANYSPTQNYQFNVTWTDNAAISAMRFEHNFTGTPTNYSQNGSVGIEYYYNYTPLAVGTYYWKSYANDTSNNTNSTPQFSYVVNRAISTCSLTLTPLSPQTYGTSVNASCSCNNPETLTKLYRNGTDITATENNTLTILPAGAWFYNCTVNQTQNYTSAQNTSTYTINKATPVLTLNISPSATVTYGTTTNVSCTANTPQVTPQLYRNGTLMSNPDVQTLAAGTYNYTCNNTATQNYTSTSTSQLLTVNKANSTVNLTLNSVDGDITITVNQTVNITGYVVTPSTGYIELYQNGTLINSGNSPLTNITNYSTSGLRNITIIYNATQNYTSSFETHFINVTTAADTTPPTWSNNKTSPTSPATYSPTQNYQSNVTWTDNIAISTVRFEHNFTGTPANYSPSGNVGSEYYYNYGPLAAGTYYWKSYANDTSGNPNATSQFTYIVNQASSTLTLSITPSTTVTYGTATNASCTASTPQITPQLFRNGSLVGNPDVQTLAAGTYNYTCNATGTQNYTAPAPQSSLLTVNKASTTTQLYLNGARSNLTVTYPTQTNATATTSNGSVTLYRNGTPVSNPEITTLPAGFYNYTAINPGNGNYLGSSETWFLTINPAADTTPPNVTLVLPANGTASSVASIIFNVSATDNVGLANITLYGNFTGVWAANETKIVTGTSNSTTFSKTLNDGTYIWNARSCDSLNNCAFAPANYTLTIDTSLPTVSFISPTPPNGAVLNITTVAINVSASHPSNNIQSCTLQWNGVNESMTKIGAGKNVTCETIKSGLTNGNYTYRAYASTNSATGMTEIRTLTIDTILPSITIFQPANITYTYKSGLPLNYTATDNVAVSTCWYSLDGGVSIALPGCSNTTFNVTIDNSHNIRVYANDTAGNTNSSIRYFSIDTIPPASVSGLNETATGENWVYWTWTNPADADFNHTEVWLNGTFRANVTAPTNSYNATGLTPNTTYQIQTRTGDDIGNINTTWVNDTATTNVSVDTTPPIISGISNGTVTNTTAVILWNTDDFSNSTVLYGTNPTNLSFTAINASYVQNHSVLLSSLVPNTTYYYNISSCSAGGCNSSGTYNFTTLAVAPALLPDGSACTLPAECQGGFCVHNICRSSATYCGDDFCDSGEGCSSCSTDCGSCGGGGGAGPAPGVPAIPITPTLPPLLVPGESEQISTIEHSEPGHILGNIEFAPAGVAARIDMSTIQAPVYEIVMMPNTDIRDSTIEITELDSIQIGNTVQFIPTHIVTVTVRLQIPIKTYTPDVGEFIYSAFSVEHVGLEGNLKEAMFRFKVSKQWISANSIDAKTVTLRRNAENEWSILRTYVVDEDADNYYYVGISPGLSTFSIVATSPPLLCSICRPGDWSACIDGEQTRLGQDCGSNTGYTCRPIVESRPCEVPTVPTPPGLPLDIIIIPIVGIAVGSYVVFSKKSW